MPSLERTSSRRRKAIVATDLVDVLACSHTVRMTRDQASGDLIRSLRLRRAEGVVDPPPTRASRKGGDVSGEGRRTLRPGSSATLRRLLCGCRVRWLLERSSRVAP